MNPGKQAPTPQCRFVNSPGRLAFPLRDLYHIYISLGSILRYISYMVIRLKAERTGLSSQKPPDGNARIYFHFSEMEN